MQIIMISGFTGIEKKNTLFSVGNEISSRDKKVVVVITEHLGEKTGRPVKTNPEVVVKEILSSCVPCSFIFDLTNELQNIYEEDAFDSIILEIPFNALPTEIKKGVSNLKFPDMSIAPMVHVFNVRNLESKAELIPNIVINQIAESDIIFVNSDATNLEYVATLKRTLGEIKTDAAIFEHFSNKDGHRFVDFVDLITKNL